jgi:hypothetical protein
MDQSLCDERVRAVNEKLERHERMLIEHDDKIDVLTKSDATNTSEIKHLCTSIEAQNKKIGKLTNSIWGLVVSVMFVLAGFFVWYVQSLPR